MLTYESLEMRDLWSLDQGYVPINLPQKVKVTLMYQELTDSVQSCDSNEIEDEEHFLLKDFLL